MSWGYAQLSVLQTNYSIWPLLEFYWQTNGLKMAWTQSIFCILYMIYDRKNWKEHENIKLWKIGPQQSYKCMFYKQYK